VTKTVLGNRNAIDKLIAPSRAIFSCAEMRRQITMQKLEIKQQNPFAMVDSKLLLSEEIGLYEKAVYCVLCAYANNDDRSCYPSYDTIARKAGCSRSKVIKVIAALEAKSLIEKQERLNNNGENKSNLYVVKPYAGAENSSQNSSEGNDLLLPAGMCEIPPNAQHTPPGTSRTPELYSVSYTHNNYIHPSVYPDKMTVTDRLTDIKNRIDYEYFEINYPDRLLAIDSVISCILELYDECPAHEIKFLDSLNCLTLMGFLDHTAGKCYAGVRNFKAYYKKMLLEYIKSEELLVSTACRL
jgi:DNA-binding MarR family transcriptional regulator